MMIVYPVLKYLHLLSISVTFILFVLRFYWIWNNSALTHQRWVRVVPHVNDTILLLTGIGLIITFQLYPLLSRDSWLTEKLIGIIVYILIGYAALSDKLHNQMLRVVAFVLALGSFGLVVSLAITKIPFLMRYL